MRTSILSAAAVFLGMMPFTLRADYLKNGDMKDRVSDWRGDGEAAFLNPDGTEGAEGDKNVIPVIKITLSKGQTRSISQDYETKGNPSTQHVRVEVYASADFKRSTFASDYSSDINWKPNSIWYWSAGAIPKVDFWIRIAPGFCYKLSNLKPGQWVTVDGKWDSGMPAEDRNVAFFVPPGEGTIYIRKATATP